MLLEARRLACRGGWVGEAEHRMAAVVRTEKRKVAAARQAAADAQGAVAALQVGRARE